MNKRIDEEILEAIKEIASMGERKEREMTDPTDICDKKQDAYDAMSSGLWDCSLPWKVYNEDSCIKPGSYVVWTLEEEGRLASYLDRWYFEGYISADGITHYLEITPPEGSHDFLGDDRFPPEPHDDGFPDDPRGDHKPIKDMTTEDLKEQLSFEVEIKLRGGDFSSYLINAIKTELARREKNEHKLLSVETANNLSQS